MVKKEEQYRVSRKRFWRFLIDKKAQTLRREAHPWPDLRILQRAVNVSDVMRRLVKEELLKFDGTPLFPERIAYTINYDLSDMEANLYASVTDYVQEEFNRADNLNHERKTTVGFALTILQRRLALSEDSAASINYNIQDLIAESEVLYQEQGEKDGNKETD